MLSFHQFHPLTLTLYYLFLLLILWLFKAPIVIFLLFISLFLFWSISQNRKSILNELVFLASLSVLIMLFTIYFYHNGATPIFYLNDQAVTTEVIFYSIVMAVAVSATWITWQALIISLPMKKIIYLTSNRSITLAIALSNFVRWIPNGKIQFQKVMEAQQSIGYFASQSKFERMYKTVKIWTNSYYNAFENTFQKSAVMHERGFKSGKRTHYQHYRLRKIDWILVISILITFFIMVINYAKLRYYFFPLRKEMTVEPIYWLVFAFISLPIIIQIKGWVQWHYYKSKI